MDIVLEYHGKNVTINSGNIQIAYGYYGYGIESDNLIINGGIVNINDEEKSEKHSKAYLGGENTKIILNCGTIIANSKRTNMKGVKCQENGLIIKGGNVIINTTNASDITDINPTNDEKNVYLTKLKISDINQIQKITNLITSDNINYGIKDMYTTEEGLVYLYLPEGTRDINIQIENKEYTANVTTTALTSEIINLIEVK